MKKLLSIILALALAFSCVPAFAESEEVATPAVLAETVKTEAPVASPGVAGPAVRAADIPAAVLATAGDTLDLANPPNGGAAGTDGRFRVRTTNNTITVSGTDALTITGDGTNGGTGWSVIVSDATEVNLEAETVIKGATGQAALRVDAADVTVSGPDSGVAPTITGDEQGIYASGNITLTGTFGNITGAVDEGIYADGDVTISGTVAGINGLRDGIYSEDGGVTISGNVTGDIKSTGTEPDTYGNYFHNGIDADGNITISGTVSGAITGSEGSSGLSADGVNITGEVGSISGELDGIYAYSGNVIISGEVGPISGRVRDGIIAGSGNVIISGDVGAITGGRNGIYSESGEEPGVGISGTVGTITGGTGDGIYAEYEIELTDAVVDDITGYVYGIRSAGVTVDAGSTVGDITGSTNDGISVNRYVTISGTVGDITGGPGPNVYGIDVTFYDVTIEGTVGTISGLAGNPHDSAVSPTPTNYFIITGKVAAITGTTPISAKHYALLDYSGTLDLTGSTPALSHTVTFDYGTLTPGGDMLKKAYLSEYTKIPAPTAAGYVTQTWYDKDGVAWVFDSSEVSGAASTLYAQSPFTAVTDITGLPSAATVGTPLTLSGTVAPADATNKTITWSVQPGGTGAATITGSRFNATAAGTVNVRATVVNGAASSTDYTEDFVITVADTPPVTYSVTVQNDGNGTASASAATAAAGAEIILTATPKTGYKFKLWQVVAGGVTVTGNKFTMPARAVTVKAIFELIPVIPDPTPVPDPTPDPIDGGSGGGGSGGGGGGGSYTPVTATTAPRHTLRKGDGYYDTLLARALEVRVYADLAVTGCTTGAEVDRLRALFERWFGNKIRAIHLDNTAPFDGEVHIAAKTDLSGWDTKKLHFYTYDPATNKYRLIPTPKYWIDANGYLHFYTALGGDIIISDGPLTTK